MTYLHAYLRVLALFLALTAPPPIAAAQLPQVASEAQFTFRTVRPPSPGAAKRIAFPGAASGRAAVKTPKPERSRWFWDKVSPARAAADSTRLASVLGAMGPELSRRGAARGVDRAADQVFLNHSAALFLASKHENLSPTLLLAVISVESAERSDAISPKGAQGLMQLIPATARRFGVSDPLDAAQNIAGGARYLSFLLDMFDRDALLALAAYNAGEGAVTRHDGVPPYAETRDYVARALAGFALLRARCANPPDGARDPCAITPAG
jgi:soluble lytic murein transglycosylase-like protein